MRRIRLELDTLRVDSFATTQPPRRAGTVAAFQDDDEDDGEDPPFNTVGKIPTCEPCDPPLNTVGLINTCDRACDASNQATCDTCVGPNCPAPA